MEVPSILLNRLLSEAAKKNAASIHLTIGSTPFMRVDGQLLALSNENIITLDLLQKIIDSFLDPNEAEVLSKNKEIVVVKTFANSFHFRINIFFQKNLPAVNFSYISPIIKDLTELNLSPAIGEILKSKSGLIIIAGSFGTGKTATVASLIESVNRTQAMHITTVEQPIEYSFISRKSIIEQRQVGKDVESFTAGLDYCLDEDVDLVYIGEMHEEFEAAAPIALELAAGNSIVIMEINADSSIRAIEKLLNATKLKTSEVAARYSLADVLKIVVVQRLLPKRGGGLVLAAEIVLANSAVKSLIREGNIYQLESTVQTSRKEGMINMDRAIDELIQAGEVRPEDV